MSALAWLGITATSAAASFAVLVIVFVPLERLFPARAGQAFRRPRFGVDLCFFLGQYLAFSSLAVGALALVASTIDGWAPWALSSSPVARLPLWPKAILSLVLGDVLVYWFHRACHRYDFLWRFHAVHHSAEHLDFLAAHREHPLDGLGTQLCQNLPAIALGLDFGAVAALAVLRGMWAVFIHSNVKLDVGPLRWIMGAPELHHWHHARVERTAHNFANLAPWLDQVFGTYHRPTGPEDYALGLTQAWPQGYLAQLVRPFTSYSNSSTTNICVASLTVPDSVTTPVCVNRLVTPSPSRSPSAEASKPLGPGSGPPRFGPL